MGPKAAGVNDSVSRVLPAHLVQLFDAPRSLADAVSHYLIEGRAARQHLLVIARASHWQLIRAYLERRGLAAADGSENFTVIDARKIRDRMMRRGVLDPLRQDARMGRLLIGLEPVRGR